MAYHSSGPRGIQWVREFHTWYAPLRVLVLHESGDNGTLSTAQLLAKAFGARDADRRGCVIVTTYESVRINEALFCAREWGYLILDEGMHGEWKSWRDR